MFVWLPVNYSNTERSFCVLFFLRHAIYRSVSGTQIADPLNILLLPLRYFTVAIAYAMRHLQMTFDDAFRYVKSKRSSISPNFNFLGQLLEYERQLRAEEVKLTKKVFSF